MAGGTPVRALVMPLALSSDQHAMYMEAAKLYNRMWGSIVSWYDAHHTVNAIAAHKALYYLFCFGEKAASSSVSRMNRLRLSLVVYVAFDYAFAVSSHGFAIVSRRPQLMMFSPIVIFEMGGVLCP